MKELLELIEKLNEVEKSVLIDNMTDNDLVDAYNQGVQAMASNMRYLINQIALTIAFPQKVGELNGN